jgi:hypothetical protein
MSFTARQCCAKLAATADDLLGLLFRRRISNQSIEFVSGLCGGQLTSVDLFLNFRLNLDDRLFGWVAFRLFGHDCLAQTVTELDFNERCLTANAPLILAVAFRDPKVRLAKRAGARWGTK